MAGLWLSGGAGLVELGDICVYNDCGFLSTDKKDSQTSKFLDQFY